MFRLVAHLLFGRSKYLTRKAVIPDSPSECVPCDYTCCCRATDRICLPGAAASMIQTDGQFELRHTIRSASLQWPAAITGNWRSRLLGTTWLSYQP